MKRRQATEIIGENIRRLRQCRSPKLTQHELAALAGVSLRTIAKVEHGLEGSVGVETAAAIADALGVRFVELLDEGEKAEARREHFAAFAKSDWCQAVRPTNAEYKWLHSLDESFWEGLNPTPQIIAELIALRRRSKAEPPTPTRPTEKRQKKRSKS